MRGHSLLVRLHGLFMRFARMLKGLTGKFMPGQMVLFVTAFRSRTMSVRGDVMHFSSNPV